VCRAITVYFLYFKSDLWFKGTQDHFNFAETVFISETKFDYLVSGQGIKLNILKFLKIKDPSHDSSSSDSSSSESSSEEIEAREFNVVVLSTTPPTLTNGRFYFHPPMGSRFTYSYIYGRDNNKFITNHVIVSAISYPIEYENEEDGMDLQEGLDSLKQRITNSTDIYAYIFSFSSNGPLEHHNIFYGFDEHTWPWLIKWRAHVKIRNE